MKYSLLSCRPGSDYTLWLLYSDGVTGLVNVGDLLEVGPFNRLRDKRIFRSARVDSETGTVAWRAGVRLDSELLYEHIRANWRRAANN